MSNPDPDLRYVLVDIEGMENGDLVAFNDGHFEKFTPLDAWADAPMPAGFANLVDFVPSQNHAPYGHRIDGLGGVHVRGVIFADRAAVLALYADGILQLVEELDGEFVGPRPGFITCTAVIIKANGATLQIPCTYIVLPDGHVGVNIGTLVAGGTLSDAIGSGGSMYLNLNGSYDTIG